MSKRCVPVVTQQEALAACADPVGAAVLGARLQKLCDVLSAEDDGSQWQASEHLQEICDALLKRVR